MSTWDDITGKTAEKKAKEYEVQSQIARNNAINTLEGNYGRLLQGSNYIVNSLMPILAQVYGTMPENNRIADEANKQVLDILMGKTSTPEQQQADELVQNYVDQLIGKNKSAEQLQADEWSQNYLNLLQGSPDTAFNAGVTNLAKNLQSQKQAVANQMQNRGIAGSGIDLDKIAGTQNDYYAGMSQLQAQRLNNKINTAQLGADFSQGIADRNLKNYGEGVSVADAFANGKLNNMVYGANMANNQKNQGMQNYLALISGLTQGYNLPSGAAGSLASQYNTDASAAQNTANSYHQAASNAGGALGGLAGTLLGGIISPVGAAIGNKIGSKIGGK